MSGPSFAGRLAGAGLVVVAGIVAAAFVVERDAEGEREREEGKARKAVGLPVDLSATKVELVASPSSAAPGWDSERVWSAYDDWEPAIAADPLDRSPAGRSVVVAHRSILTARAARRVPR